MSTPGTQQYDIIHGLCAQLNGPDREVLDKVEYRPGDRVRPGGEPDAFSLTPGDKPCGNFQQVLNPFFPHTEEGAAVIRNLGCLMVWPPIAKISGDVRSDFFLGRHAARTISNERLVAECTCMGTPCVGDKNRNDEWAGVLFSKQRFSRSGIA